jgi:hypothetical protein
MVKPENTTWNGESANVADLIREYLKDPNLPREERKGMEEYMRKYGGDN